MEVSNNKIPLDQFFEERKNVLRMWKTGYEVENLEESFRFHKKLGESKNVAAALKKAHSEGRTLIALRCGKPTVEEQIEDLLYIQDAGADLLPVTLDSYTRNLRFTDNEESLKEIILILQRPINQYDILVYGKVNIHLYGNKLRYDLEFHSKATFDSWNREVPLT
jgi:methylaspartate mutase epsilon subunit